MNRRPMSPPGSYASIVMLAGTMIGLGGGVGVAADNVWLGMSPESSHGSFTLSIHGSDIDVEGWSVSVCFDPDTVMFRRVESGSAIVELDAAGITERASVSVGTGRVTQIVDTVKPVRLDATGLPILELAFAAHEESMLQVCPPSGVSGEPPPFTVTHAGGTILVPEVNAGATLLPPQLRVDPPISDGHVTLRLKGEGMQGWSLGLCHDRSAAELTRFSISEDLDTVRDGFPPSFLILEEGSSDTKAGIIQVVVLSHFAPLALPVVESGFPILEADYLVSEESTLEVCSGLAGAGQDIEVVLTIDGESFHPEESTSVLRPKPYRNQLALITEPPEASEVVTVKLYSEEVEASGWSFALCHTAGAAEVEELQSAPELQMLIGGEPPQFVLNEVLAAEPFVAVRQTVVLGSVAEPALAGPFPGGLPLLGVRYQVHEEDVLKFCDTVGGIRFRNEVVIDGIGYEPARREGSRLVLGALGTTFIRGDANLDRTVNVADAAFILNALFSGTTTMLCRDAADVNDVGKVDISDPIFLLRYLFTGGPQPQPPFPDPGEELSPATALGCERGL